MSQFSRQDLKKNELAEIIGKAVEWITHNRNTFYGISATVAGAIIIAVIFTVRMHDLKIRGGEKLAVAQGLLYQGQAGQGMALLDELISSFSSGEISSKAQLAKAEFFISQRNYKDAEQSVLAVVQNGKPKTVLPLALSMLGVVQENGEKFQEAAATYNSFLDKYPDHFLAPKTYESLARVREVMGQPLEARSTYEKIATLYPGTAWAMHAQERLAALPVQQTQQPANPMLNMK